MTTYKTHSDALLQSTHQRRNHTSQSMLRVIPNSVAEELQVLASLLCNQMNCYRAFTWKRHWFPATQFWYIASLSDLLTMCQQPCYRAAFTASAVSSSPCIVSVQHRLRAASLESIYVAIHVDALEKESCDECARHQGGVPLVLSVSISPPRPKQIVIVDPKFQSFRQLG